MLTRSCARWSTKLADFCFGVTQSRLLWPCLVLVWAAVMFPHLYFFSMPWMDTWCYFAPALIAPTPGHISAPFMGSFLGYNQDWGLHLPGAPLIYSVITPVLPKNGLTGVAILLCLWALTATVAFCLTERLTSKRICGLFGGCLVLADRNLFAIAHAQRPEMLAALILLLLVFVWIRGRESQSLWWPLAGGGCIAVLTTLHPLSVLISASFCFGLLLFVCYQRQWSARSAIVIAFHWGGLLLGALFLYSWFSNHPASWVQFQIHADANRGGFTWGRTLVRSLQQHYPLYAGHILYVSSLFLGLFALTWLRKTDKCIAESACLFQLTCGYLALSAIICQQLFANTFYLAVIFPLVAAQFAAGLPIYERLLKHRGKLVYVIAAVLLVAQAAHIASRSEKFYRSGLPNIREELQVFMASLPPHKRVLIPEALWEAALTHSSAVLMNTVPHSIDREHRLKYEAEVYSQMESGDLAVVNSFQANAILQAFPNDRWELIEKRTKKFPGKPPWGYEFSVFRRR